jgi:tRNA threonylcarbamoyladenosine biosynthesis protein TsaE
MGEITHVTCRSVAETEALAATLADVIRPGDVLGLSGNLGAGKTTFARGFVRALTNATDDVPSPTFTLVQTYDTAKGALWHCDLYRLTKPDDALELGLDEAFATSICLIEWPERMGQLLPARRLLLSFEFDATDANKRRLVFDGGVQWLDRLKKIFP